jgi:hypothetical protein
MFLTVYKFGFRSSTTSLASATYPHPLMQIDPQGVLKQHLVL